MEIIINLIETPQRADIEAIYTTNNNILTIQIGETTEIFDFTEMPEGKAEEIITEELPINPIVSVEKIADEINIVVIRFYDETEKHIFEVVQNG